MDAFLSVLPQAMLAAALIALIVCACIAFRYLRKNRSPSYPLHDYTSLTLTGRRDLYIGRHVTRVRIQTDKKR